MEHRAVVGAGLGLVEHEADVVGGGRGVELHHDRAERRLEDDLLVLEGGRGPRGDVDAGGPARRRRGRPPARLRVGGRCEGQQPEPDAEQRHHAMDSAGNAPLDSIARRQVGALSRVIADRSAGADADGPFHASLQAGWDTSGTAPTSEF